jgi:uncharacterized protein (TIGR03437 family)
MKAAVFLFVLTAGTLIYAQPPGGGPPGGGGGASGDGIWRRNAGFGESLTFDSCEGHQPNSGQYHYHVNPTCLRAQLGDNITVVKNTRVGAVYQEKTTGLKHSPILGWANDGYPIYGPYGYSDPKNASSTVRRMVSSFSLRNITARTSLPTWTLGEHSGISQTLTSSQYGPAVSTAYPLGRYVEDYDYVAGSGDLDQYNGRTTVTPDFPNGTYAYFVTIDANGNPAFPFIIAGQYYGTASAASVTSVPSTATSYFANGTYTQSQSTTPLLAAWSTTYSTQFAKVVSGIDPAAGASTTWPGTTPTGVSSSTTAVTSPIYGDVQAIKYTSSSVYVSANGVPGGYAAGPWFGFTTNGGVFGNYPVSQGLTYQIPSSPTPAASPATTSLGTAGLWVNGVAVFNFLDGASYSNSSGADVGGGSVAPGVIHVSGASFENGPSAPGSIVAGFPIFTATIASSTAAASSAAWPTTLGGVTVTVKDSSSTTKTAQISYASPSQVNFVVPSGLASGAATVSYTVNGTAVTGAIDITPTYPNLFTVNTTGGAAAYSQTVNGTAYLVLFGSGLGTATSATATIGGVNATVSYAGPQGTYPGLDQYNIAIPASVVGKGQADVIVTAAGLPSNTVNFVF